MQMLPLVMSYIIQDTWDYYRIATSQLHLVTTKSRM